MARPANSKPAKRKCIALDDGLWEAVSKYRFAKRIPSETEAIRRLIQKGIDSEPNGEKDGR